jgi:hypothetical protein
MKTRAVACTLMLARCQSGELSVSGKGLDMDYNSPQAPLVSALNLYC